MALSNPEIMARTETFRQLHVPGNPFILANAWDIGSARMLANLGAKAIATTSAGHAFTLGRPDMGHVSRDEAITHAVDLNEATDLPLNGDLENGYGPDLLDVAATVAAAAQAGLAGLGIEDTALPSSDPYPFAVAVERIEAAVAAKQGQTNDVVLTARADGVMNGHYDVAEAIRRIQAFEKAGADVLYVPLPPDMEALGDVCRSVEKPVNVLCAGKFVQHRLADFAACGAARVSLGSALARITHRAIYDASKAMFDDGDMSLLANSIGGDEIDPLLKRSADDV